MKYIHVILPSVLTGSFRKQDRKVSIGLYSFRVLANLRGIFIPILIRTFGDGIINRESFMTEEIYEKFDAYNWDGDEAFKAFIILSK